VSAVLVNYNAGPELGKALQSIASELSACEWEAIVVDNASSDGSVSIVSSFGPRVRLLANAVNVGFSRGVNQGVAASAGGVLLIMNPDCRLVAGAFAYMRRELERSPGVAIVGPRILDPDGSVQGSARGDPDMFTGVFGRTTRLRRFLPDLSVSRRNVVTDAAVRHADAVTVDWVSGACMVVRREAFDEVRGFDERYFLYWEDADLCRRLRARGYKIRYVPTATAVHRVGQSSRKARKAAIRAFHESAYLYYATHVAPESAPKRIVARILLTARSWVHLRRSAPQAPLGSATGGAPAE
jgi:GT2 family glycosyltransferase